MPSQNNRTAIILAGGLSKRMGFNKEYIKINNEYLIYRQIEQLKPLFNEIIVVSNNKDFYKNKQVHVVQDIIQKKSPLVGLHAGLTHSTNNQNYLIACDMPNIDATFVSKLLDGYKGEECCVVLKNGYYEPFNALYSKRILTKLESFIKTNLKFQDFIETLEKSVITSLDGFNQTMFHNLNSQQDLSNQAINPKTVEEFEVIKLSNENKTVFNDFVIKEFPMTLYINSEKHVTMLITPSNIKELIIGYMKSEKIIYSFGDIEEILIDEDQYKVNVTLVNKQPLPSSNKDKLLTSGCGVGTRFHEDIDNILIDSIDSNFTISALDISNATNELNNKSGLFKLTGGVHSCLFIYDDTDVYFEDIGRHNAVDKVIGFIELNNIQTKNSFIISSGRISSDMLIKCSISRIPIVISRSAPTSLAVTLAETLGITLIGFARGNRFNIYTNKYRVVR